MDEECRKLAKKKSPAHNAQNKNVSSKNKSQEKKNASPSTAAPYQGSSWEIKTLTPKQAHSGKWSQILK